MFYILYGQDDFSLYQAVGRIKSSLGNSEALGVNTAKLDGEHLTLSELENNCSTVPFLAPYRLVIVNGLLERFEPKRGKSRMGKRVLPKSQNELGEWQNLSSYIKQMPATTVLILVDGKISNRNPLMKRLSSLAKVEIFRLLRGKSLKDWIQQRVSEEGGNITPEAVNLLAEFIGGDLWVMNNEITKLLLYVQRCPITEDDIKRIVSYTQEVNIFALVDAILEGQATVAQELLQRLYQAGTSPIYILVMITRQFRLAAQARELIPQLSRQQIQDRLGLTSSYALDKTLRQARQYDFEQIKEAYNKLLNTDLAIKTGKYNDQLALELLIAELAGSLV
jgi:DNA polymerase-3 subunit delta